MRVNPTKLCSAYGIFVGISDEGNADAVSDFIIQ